MMDVAGFHLAYTALATSLGRERRGGYQQCACKTWKVFVQCNNDVASVHSL